MLRFEYHFSISAFWVVAIELLLFPHAPLTGISTTVSLSEIPWPISAWVICRTQFVMVTRKRPSLIANLETSGHPDDRNAPSRGGLSWIFIRSMLPTASCLCDVASGAARRDGMKVNLGLFSARGEMGSPICPMFKLPTLMSDTSPLMVGGQDLDDAGGSSVVFLRC